MYNSPKDNDYIPAKVDDYSKKLLAEMIFSGKISREQVYEDGLFRKHRPLLEKELSLMTQEELDWAEATKKNTIGSYQVYLEKYNPTIVEGETVTDGWIEDTVYIGRHVEDARRLQAAVKKHNDDETEKEKDKAAWAKAKNADTIEIYIEYISTFDRQPPMYRGQYVDEAKLRINKLQDKIDWEKAKLLNTIESYKTYLSKYDSQTSSYQGAYILDAKKAIERLTSKPVPAPNPLRNETEDWATAVRVDTIEAYKNYLTKYESIGGKYVAQAKNAIERLLEEKTWSEALDSNDIDGYKKYISTYQNKKGKHLADAKLRLNQLEDDFAWMAATKEDNLSTFRDYLLHYDVLAPKYRGRHIEDVKKRITHIDDKEWKKANKADNLTAYRLYVNKFSGDNFGLKGKHIEEAETRINRIMDDTCWADAIKKNTIEAYQNYLNQYPHGIHSNEATKNIAIPNPNPNGCLKSFVWLVLFVVLLFLGWQYWNHHWPFYNENTLNPGDDTTEIVKLPVFADSISNDEQEQINIENNPEMIDENNDSSVITEPAKKTQVKADDKNSRSDNSPIITVPIQPNKDEIFKNAKTRKNIKEIERLANMGYVPSYIYLAQYYLKNPATHNLAYKYAKLAKKAGVKKADEIIKTLELYDY